MPAITNDWAEYLKPEYSKEYYRDLFNLSVSVRNADRISTR